MIWLAFDIGTTGTKAALIGQDGRTIRSAYRDYETVTCDGRIEQNAEDWWRAALEAAHKLLAVESGEIITAITITGQMQDVILVDADSTPVRPVILYSDHRAQDEIVTITQAIGAERLTQITGNEQTASSLLAKLLWLKRHEPDSLSRARYLLVGAADFIVLKLTGVTVCDTTTASTTGLLDLDARQWLSDDLFAAMDLQEVPHLLPPVVDGGIQIGTLAAEAAVNMGLSVGTPVYLAPGDAGATTLGVGSGEPGLPYAYIGTSGWVAYTSHHRRGDPSTGVFTLAHPDRSRYLCIAPILTAGGNLDWITQTLKYSDVATMIQAALDSAPTSLLYLPYLNGERSPFSDPAARGAFIGLNSAHTSDALARAVLEGVVFAFKHALDALIETPIAALTLTGGGTRTAGYNQMFADVTRLPVGVAEDAANVGVRGAVLSALVKRNDVNRYAPDGWFPIASTHAPTGNADLSAHYAKQYNLFRAAYPALKDIFKEMN